MAKAEDLLNQRFGRWLVLGRAPNRNKTMTYWNCQCDCGAKKEVRTQSLISGKSESCGCLKDEISKQRLINTPITARLPKGEAALNTIINSYKQSAKSRNLKWCLTREQVKDITKQNCYYCDKEPAQIKKDKGQNGEYIYNGIDRVNSDQDYTLQNTVACCSICNYAKSDLSYNEFIEWIERAYRKTKQLEMPRIKAEVEAWIKGEV